MVKINKRFRKNYLSGTKMDIVELNDINLHPIWADNIDHAIMAHNYLEIIKLDWTLMFYNEEINFNCLNHLFTLPSEKNGENCHVIFK